MGGAMTSIAVDLAAATLAGLIAGPLMEVPAYAQRLLRLPVHQDVFAEAGVIIGMRGKGRRLVGYLGHAVLSVLIAVLYAVFFRAVGSHEQLLAWGALGGLVHFTIGGLVVDSGFPVLDREVLAEGEHRLGFAYANYGRRDVLTFLGGHVFFGMLIGALYPMFHPAVGAWAAL
jgi:hypothetical protein